MTSVNNYDEIFNNVLDKMGPINVDNYFQLRNNLLEESLELSKTDYNLIPKLLDMNYAYLQTNMMRIFSTSCLDVESIMSAHMTSFSMHLLIIRGDFLYYSCEAIRQSISDIKNDEQLNPTNSIDVKNLLARYESLYEQTKKKLDEHYA